MRSKTFAKVPAPGQWPVGPQTDLEISRARLWIDGCFDFSHHGMSLQFSSCSCSRQQLKGQLRPCWCNSASKEAGQAIGRWSPFR